MSQWPLLNVQALNEPKDRIMASKINILINSRLTTEIMEI